MVCHGEPVAYDQRVCHSAGNVEHKCNSVGQSHAKPVYELHTEPFDDWQRDGHCFHQRIVHAHDDTEHVGSCYPECDSEYQPAADRIGVSKCSTDCLCDLHWNQLTGHEWQSVCESVPKHQPAAECNDTCRGVGLNFPLSSSIANNTHNDPACVGNPLLVTIYRLVGLMFTVSHANSFGGDTEPARFHLRFTCTILRPIERCCPRFRS